MKTLKIDKEEIIKLIENTYNIKHSKFMRKGGFEVDYPLGEDFDYVEGNVE